MAGVADVVGRAGDGVSVGAGFIRAGAAGPRCGGLRGWRPGRGMPSPAAPRRPSSPAPPAPRPPARRPELVMRLIQVPDQGQPVPGPVLQLALAMAWVMKPAASSRRSRPGRSGRSSPRWPDTRSRPSGRNCAPCGPSSVSLPMTGWPARRGGRPGDRRVGRVRWNEGDGTGEHGLAPGRIPDPGEMRTQSDRARRTDWPRRRQPRRSA